MHDQMGTPYLNSAKFLLNAVTSAIMFLPTIVFFAFMVLKKK